MYSPDPEKNALSDSLVRKKVISFVGYVVSILRFIFVFFFFVFCFCLVEISQCNITAICYFASFQLDSSSLFGSREALLGFHKALHNFQGSGELDRLALIDAISSFASASSPSFFLSLGGKYGSFHACSDKNRSNLLRL